MAVVLTCHHCGSEYACSETIPDPCQKCGVWHRRFKTPDYLENIVMNQTGRSRQWVRKGWNLNCAMVGSQGNTKELESMKKHPSGVI